MRPGGDKEAMQQLVRFALDGQAFALPLAQVVRAVPAAQVTPVPDMPAPVRGVVDVAGELLPVLDLRQPARAIGVDDQFLVIRTARRPLVLVVDATQGVVEHDVAALPDLPPFGPPSSPFDGAVRCGDDLVLLHDSERFLADHVARALERVLGPGTPEAGLPS